MSAFLSVPLLLAASLFPAADETNPNTLTSKEIADGWILLFDGKTTFGWRIDGDATVEKSMLIVGGAKATTAAFTTQFGYGALAFAALTDDAKDARLTFNAYKERAFLHVAPPSEKGWHGFHAQVGKIDQVGRIGAEVPIRPPDDISIWADGSKGFGIQGIFDQPTLIAFHVPAGQKLLLRSIKFRPSSLKPIFNGQDLSGWKKFEGDEKRAKSQFTVTREGWLNINNGPGDLQTEGQYDDFLLQIDCISNGKHLNSGVFFRCRPNEYQNGYEAQIHNGFTAPPGKEYTLEEYDPATHKLIDKKKVKYAAMDYGTGAIYRRIPARFQVAKDNEWFTMTVAAQGKHIATWVNGIQMIDWTDNRPLADNARNGCKLGKGHISLQGHDPTTNLSFRNIRIAELPKITAP
jgi:hypothetical protein